MIDFYSIIPRDQNWDFIGVIIGAAALLATIFIYFLQKNKKSLSYEILSKSTLLSTNEKLQGKLKVLYNDIFVQSIIIFELKVMNSGKSSISSSDYERPLSFKFAEKGNILATEIIETFPKSLSTDLIVEGNKVIVKPVLMNAKDYIVFKIVVADCEKNEVETDARIKDVKDVKKINDSSFNLLIMVLGSILSFVGTYQVTNIEKTITIPWTIERVIGYILFFLGYLIMFTPIILKRRSKKRGGLSFLDRFR